MGGYGQGGNTAHGSVFFGILGIRTWVVVSALDLKSKRMARGDLSHIVVSGH